LKTVLELRVDDPRRPSAFGDWHYEVADTKLARHVKASAVLQICTYIELLERIQGVRPEWMYVALGGSARAIERLRVDDYMAYYRAARDRFLATMTSTIPAVWFASTYSFIRVGMAATRTALMPAASGSGCVTSK